MQNMRYNLRLEFRPPQFSPFIFQCMELLQTLSSDSLGLKDHDSSYQDFSILCNSDANLTLGYKLYKIR